MNLFLKQVTVICPGSKYHNKLTNILIEKGVISSIGTSVKKPSNCKEYYHKGACVSIGWFDIGTQIGEPGYEQRETISTVSKAAAAGGYTGIACFPNTNPPLHSKSEIQYINHNSKNEIVDIYPIGALSKYCKGEEMTEMIDMSQAGAIAFSDGRLGIEKDGLLLRALEYSKSINKTIVSAARKQSFTSNGLIHEGISSTKIGVPGIPHIAEDITVDRDIKLCEYVDGRLLIHNISSKGSVGSIKTARKTNQNISASVSYLNLVANETFIESFDENYKVLPPLRSKKDQSVLRNAVQNNDISVITSNHEPIEEEIKSKEFFYAEFGAIGLETCFPALNTFAKDSISLDQIIQCITVNPRSILGIPTPTIENGSAANMTVFDPTAQWTLHKKNINSKSKNSPYIGTEFTGKILGIIANNKVSGL